MQGFLIRWLIVALSLYVADRLVPGIVIGSGATLLFAAALLGVVNAIVRPVVVLLTFPITLLTLGLFLLVINAGMLGLVAWLLDDFTIAGFWSALVGAVIVSLTGWIASSFVGNTGKYDRL